MIRSFRKFKRQIKTDGRRYRLLCSVKAAVILADSCGSGLVRENKPLSGWINEAFDSSLLLDSSAVFQKIIEPRKKQINSKMEKTGVHFEWQDFQLAADTLPSRTLFLASCGSGKTLAAWRWIAARAKEKPVARVIFLYPTRATATEGFKDYISWAPETDAALIHGTAEYELCAMLENPEDGRFKKDFRTEDRLFALAYWKRRIFSATVDQFLGFMQYSYRSMCLLPVLADSVVVFDEVHSFDESLFSVLMGFLKAFDVPALCMTATLPLRRIKELEVCGLTVFPKIPQQFKNLQEREQMPRYRIKRVGSKDEAAEIAEKFRNGNKILWVVNLVARCQESASRYEGICYHSRFRLDDRNDRHEEVIGRFKKGDNDNGVLAITTQVCEMSLDLDADILITEDAPITALIQRMGRCNRHARPGDNKTGTVIIYPPENRKPYDDKEWVGVEDFIKEIDGKTVNQKELAMLLEKYGPRAPTIEKYAAFLESGPWAMAHEESLWDEGNFTVQVILDGDIEKYLQLRKNKKPADGLLLPVPRRFAKRHERLGAWPPVADSVHYHPLYGFMDKPMEKNNG